METTNTVLQKFWQRVFNSPDGHAMNIRNTFRDAPIYAFASPMGGVAYVPPAYLPLTYMQMGKAVATMSAFLKKRGLKRGVGNTEGDRVAIIAWNSPEWVIFDLAVQSVGGVTVPIYPNNGPEQVNYVLQNSDARWVFSDDPEQLKKVNLPGCEAILFQDIPNLLTGEQYDDRSFVEHFLAVDDFERKPSLVSVATEQLMEFQQAALDKPCCGIKPNDLATIIYTSGSTGVPKGVELTHDNFAAACQSMVAAGFELQPASDIYLSYLPLAHVYERAGGASLCIWSGIPMAFEPNVKKVRDTLPVVMPTLFHGVPAVWRGAQDAILGRATGIQGKILHWALSLDKNSMWHWLADLVVFRRIRNGLGGRIRIATSGGAPLSKESVEFFQKAGIEISQGYGLTETTGAVTVNRPSGCNHGRCNKAGTVGPVLDSDGTEIRIAAIDGQVGQGEIQIKGRKVMRGYWKLPDETKKVFTEDGWFRTGDLGYFDEDNFLVITGRLKRLLKTDGGKYVAPEKIEKAFEGNPIVQCNVTVGDGMPYMAGLIFIGMPYALQIAAAAGITPPAGADVPTFLSQQKVIVDAVQKAVDNANAKLERWEQYKKFHIIPVEATVDNGLLTPTQKIRTEEVLKRYKAEIDALFQKPKGN